MMCKTILKTTLQEHRVNHHHYLGLCYHGGLELLGGSPTRLITAYLCRRYNSTNASYRCYNANSEEIQRTLVREKCTTMHGNLDEPHKPPHCLQHHPENTLYTGATFCKSLCCLNCSDSSGITQHHSTPTEKRKVQFKVL
jgi:hypothetical protein